MEENGLLSNLVDTVSHPGAHPHAHIHTHDRAHAHVHTHTRAHTHTHTRTHTHTHTHTRTHDHRTCLRWTWRRFVHNWRSNMSLSRTRATPSGAFVLFLCTPCLFVGGTLSSFFLVPLLHPVLFFSVFLLLCAPCLSLCLFVGENSSPFFLLPCVYEQRFLLDPVFVC